jgi:hypothetical protein
VDILVREFEEADREALSPLYVASRNATFTLNSVEMHQACVFGAHTEGEKILVAVANAEIFGFASIWEPDNYFSDKPTLKCLEDNVNATQFYESQGWESLREVSGPDVPYLLMTKAAAKRNAT